MSISRRSILAGGTGALAAIATNSLALAQEKKPGMTPEPARKRQSGPGPGAGADPNSPLIGKPVSDTAAAQGNKPQIPAPPKPKVRFAVVGLGKLMVEESLPAFDESQECEVTALVTGNAEKGRLIAANLGLSADRVFGYGDIPSFAKNDAIDAVYIATPNTIHKRDTVAAFQAGKHVICEKPLATTVEDCQAMIDAANSAGRKFMTAYRVHHEPINKKIRQMLRAKTYGRPHFITYDAVLDVGPKPQSRLDKSLAGHGSLFDIGIYALNGICWLLGEAPIEISAMEMDKKAMRESRFDELEGSIAFQLRFASGTIANCTSSYATTRLSRYRIICEKGWLGMSPANWYRGLKGEHGTDAEESTLKEPESVNQFAAEFDHFARCIRDGETVDSPGEEGLRDVRLMLAIYEAARSGKSVKV